MQENENLRFPTRKIENFALQIWYVGICRPCDPRKTPKNAKHIKKVRTKFPMQPVFFPCDLALTVVIYGKKSPSKSPSKSHVPQTVGQRVPQILDYVPQILSWGTYSQHQTPSIGGQPVTLYLSSYSIEWIKHFKRVNLTKRSLFSRRWKITNGRFEKGGACRCNYVVDPSFMAETTTTPSPPRNHPKKIVS